MQMRRAAVVLALAALVATGCAGSSGGSAAAPSPTPTADSSAADTAAVTTAWEAFFKAGGPVDAHIALLEDGEKFRTELTASAKDPTNAFLHAKVSHVVVTGAKAAVTYDLLTKGEVVLLGGAGGEAAKVGGRWLVSKATYCQLISLQDPTTAHPGCTS
jgi:hypothetical protein